MPNTPKGGGISRKIFNPGERKKIRTILNDIIIPKGFLFLRLKTLLLRLKMYLSNLGK